VQSYYSSPDTHSYLWSKYRPAILKLMVDSEEGPQQYNFFKHEISRAYPRLKRGFSFKLKVYQNKPVNDIKGSVIAQDLLKVLRSSGTASELVEDAVYEFQLDKQYNLHITKESAEGLDD